MLLIGQRLCAINDVFKNYKEPKTLEKIHCYIPAESKEEISKGHRLVRV